MRDESFWEYSCRVYALPGISLRCLGLQNEHGLDVNMLLFAAWYASTRGRLPEALLQDAVRYSRAWSASIVTPLRRARTWLKEKVQNLEPVSALEQEGMETLRTHIKTLELRTEQHQQTQLEALVREPARAVSEEECLTALQDNLQRTAAMYAESSEDLQEGLSALCSDLASA